MSTATESLLRELEESVAAQLAAAQTLDAAGLQSATDRRHAAITALSIGPRPDPDLLRDPLKRIRSLDVRLVRILKAGERTFRRILHPQRKVYDSSGRIREERI